MMIWAYNPDLKFITLEKTTSEQKGKEIKTICGGVLNNPENYLEAVNRMGEDQFWTRMWWDVE